MTLHSQTIGTGRDLVLLHGWGMHSGIWDDVALKLATEWRVTVIDLPGHGRSRDSSDITADLPQLAATVAAKAPPEAIWLGWSFGGMVAMQVAIAQPGRVRRLALVAANSRFAASDQWPFGMKPELLTQFEQNLETDYRKTLERFLGLQTSGDARARYTWRELQERILQLPAPETAALRAALTILQSADLTPELKKIQCPVLLMLGRQDLLVPRSAGPALIAQLPQAQLHIFPQAGHAPFISHPEDFFEVLSHFLA